MSLPASIFIWLKRGLWMGAILLLGLVLGLYFWTAAIVETVLSPQLKERGGKLEIDSIRLSLSGVELQVERYAETDFELRGLRVTCPWSQLWSIEEGFEGEIHIAHLELQMPEVSTSEVEAESVSARVGAQLGVLVDLLDSLPLKTVDLGIDELSLSSSELEWHTGLTAHLIKSSSGEVHLTAVAESANVSLEAKLKVLSAGQGLALDFVLSAKTWDEFQASYLGALAKQAAASGLEFYLQALDNERGFLDVSGYARWRQSAPNALSYTVLAELGAAEVYWPQGELFLKKTSLGWASDGRAHTRGYAKGAIDSLRKGSWTETGGDWEVRLDGAPLVGELRLGESLALSLAHEDWQQLLVGSGSGRFYVDAKAVNAELLRAFEIPELPDDLELEMLANAEGEATFEAWKPLSAKVKVDAVIENAALAGKGIVIKHSAAQADLQLAAGRIEAGGLHSTVKQLSLFGFNLNEMKLGFESKGTDVFLVAPITANIMGGSLRTEALQIDLKHLENTVFRVNLTQIDLTQLAQAVPQFKGEVSGKISGYLVGRLKGGQPLLTDGRLEIDSATGARLHYDASGLLTRGMSKNTPAYQQYRMAELAFQDLALKRFSIDVFPDGNASRPFRLQLFGESLQGKTVVPVDFKLNVNVEDTAGLLELLRMIQRSELELNSK